MDRQLALVAIVKNESSYLLEWLAHYRTLGVRDFYIYDHENTGSESEFLRRLESASIINRIYWSVAEGVSPQISAYNDAVSRLKSTYNFAAFFDIDEFLATKIDLLSWLKSLPSDVGGIAINQRVFGSSKFKHREPGLVTARFKLASTVEYGENRWVKSILRLSNVQMIGTPHRAVLHSGKYIHPNGRQAFPDKPFIEVAELIDYSYFQLNHYILKSEEEFLEKKSRGGVSGSTELTRSSRYDSNYFTGRDSMINEVEDTTLADRESILKSEISTILKAIS